MPATMPRGNLCLGTDTEIMIIDIYSVQPKIHTQKKSSIGRSGGIAAKADEHEQTSSTNDRIQNVFT